MLSTIRAISSGPASIGRNPGINFTREKRVFLAASSSPHTRMSQSGVWDRSCSASAERLWKAANTGVPAGVNSRTCSAADPCQTPSIRVGLPPIVAARGTVVSTRMASFREPRMLFNMAACAGNGTAITTTDACAAACEFSHPLTSRLCARGDPPVFTISFSRSAASWAFFSSREPMKICAPASDHRSASPKPRSPVPPMTDLVCSWSADGIFGGANSVEGFPGEPSRMARCREGCRRQLVLAFWHGRSRLGHPDRGCARLRRRFRNRRRRMRPGACRRS